MKKRRVSLLTADFAHTVYRKAMPIWQPSSRSGSANAFPARRLPGKGQASDFASASILASTYKNVSNLQMALPDRVSG